jgi:glycosidase
MKTMQLNKSAVYHRSIQPYIYSFSKDVVHLRLQTGVGEVTQVEIIYGDPFEQDKNQKWIHHVQAMIKFSSDEFFDYWTVSIKPPGFRLRYLFRLGSSPPPTPVLSLCPASSQPSSSDDNLSPRQLVSVEKEDEKIPKEKAIYYSERGFIGDYLKNMNHLFCFPYLHQIDVFSPPEWVKDTVWYQIFPERFANGDPSRNPKGVLPWGSTEPTVTCMFGGDFQGIINHIDHLKELGITGIYFTPIFLSKTNHKYDTIDYFEIDPHFGDKETFRKMVNLLHQSGIRVMLDAVFNHCGLDFFAFKDVCEKGAASPYKDWFYYDDLPLRTEPVANYRTFGYFAYMPKLNTQNPDVRKYLVDVGTYWAREFGIDGWRLDVANEVDHSFWREFRSAVKSVNPDCYIVGEIWHDALPWLHGDQFDSTMNYPLQQAVLSFFAGDSSSEGDMPLNAAEFKNILIKLLLAYPEGVNSALFNLLDSHDTARILTYCKESLEKLKMILLFHLSWVGTPCIYYGTEVGMKGENDPGCRGCMVWDPKKQDKQIFQFVQKLVAARRNCDAFGSKGKLRIIEGDAHNNSFIYEKSTDTQVLLFILNNSKADLSLEVKHWAFDDPSRLGSVGSFLSSTAQSSLKVVQGHCLVDLEGFGFQVLQINLLPLSVPPTDTESCLLR